MGQSLRRRKGGAIVKTLYEIKLRKARIDTERIQNGLEPMYAAYEKELNAKQAKIHRAYDERKAVQS